jgi:hypothetical protein
LPIRPKESNTICINYNSFSIEIFNEWAAVLRH